ncbi:MAG: hypothetical protein MHM6MM_003056 [Cercozoa sp. M6MM]
MGLSGADVFMIISGVVLSCVLVGLCFVVFVKYAHPDDRTEAWLPKVVTILGFALAFGQVMILPYDAANATGYADIGSLNIGLLWQIVFVLSALFLAFVIPFAFWYYEAYMGEQGSKSQQICDGFKYAIVSLIVFVAIFAFTYPFLSDTQLPVTARSVSYSNTVHVGNSSSVSLDLVAMAAKQKSADLKLEFRVTLPVFAMALLSFLGWFLFALFAGIGLFALPVDLFFAWKNRPSPITLRQYETMRQKLGEKAREVRQECESLVQREESEDKTANQSWRVRRRRVKHFRGVEQQLYELRKDFEIIETAYKLRGGNPLTPWFKLLLSVVLMCVSLVWIVHVCLFMLPDEPVHPFLNDFLIALSPRGLPFFGVLAFALFALHMMCAALKGLFRFGMRVPGLLRIYPMLPNATYMNAFLANTWVALAVSIPCVQFCARAFPVYARLTAVDMLVGTQVQHLRFFRYFFENNVFAIALLSVAVLTFIFVACVLPRNRSKEVDKQLNRMQRTDNREFRSRL